MNSWKSPFGGFADLQSSSDQFGELAGGLALVPSVLTDSVASDVPVSAGEDPAPGSLAEQAASASHATSGLAPRINRRTTGKTETECLWVIPDLCSEAPEWVTAAANCGFLHEPLWGRLRAPIPIAALVRRVI